MFSIQRQHQTTLGKKKSRKKATKRRQVTHSESFFFVRMIYILTKYEYIVIIM